ncbi:MAG: ECF-type sigma factor [Gemmataceae bacterium]
MSHVTQLLDAAANGDPKAAAAILPLVYDELRQLAATRMVNEQPGHTLDATALVHEAYLRLIGPDGTSRYANRGHFFAAAAQAMRRILVDHARRRSSTKRDGGERVDLDLDKLPASKLDADVLAVDEAVAKLAQVEPRVAELVTLRFFGGLTVLEAAASLGVSPRTVDAWWAYARAWLAADLGEL